MRITRTERWVHYQIFGRWPDRQPRRKSRRGPARSRKYRAWIRSLPSCVSGRPHCEAAHTGDDGGMSMKASDYTCVPLTAEEHCEYHRVGRAAFAAAYGLNLDGIVEELMRAWRASGRTTK